MKISTIKYIKRKHKLEILSAMNKLLDSYNLAKLMQWDLKT